MRVLLDECLPRRLKQELLQHDVVTVPEAGWAGKHNGDLLKLAAGTFDVFVTIDQHLAAQQPLEKSWPAILVLAARSNRFNDLQPLILQLVEAIASSQPGQLTRIGT